MTIEIHDADLIQKLQSIAQSENRPVEAVIESMINRYKINDLRKIIISARENGQSQEDIIRELEKLRKLVDETQEDLILDMMDFLTGWCSPDMKID